MGHGTSELQLELPENSRLVRLHHRFPESESLGENLGICIFTKYPRKFLACQIWSKRTSIYHPHWVMPKPGHTSDSLSLGTDETILIHQGINQAKYSALFPG
jgi:hypothetical protein